MAKTYPQLRCICCGKRVFFNNLNRVHSLDAWAVTFGGGRYINYEPTEFKGPNSIEDWWIKKLEATLLWLKLKKGSIVASEKSALIPTEASLLTSGRQANLILNAPKVSYVL